jgi:SAM-dependent methyltransferase
MDATKTIDERKAEAFAERMVGVLNGGATALLTSVGHRTGLFDAMAAMEPATSVEIAAKASRDERYVREWLGGMVASRIVDYEPETGRYALPAEHAAFLTRDAAPNNIAAFAQYTAVLGSVEDRIVDCFEKGGGVPYSAYDRFHEVMAEDSGQTVVPALIDAILPLVPGLTEKLEQGIDVLDVGCGSGRALNLMARRFPRSRFTGWDLCEDAVEAARAQANGTPNLSFEVRDLTGFDRDDEAEEGFDLVTAFDAVHDQKSPDALLRGVRRAVREDGAFLMQDIRASTRVERNVEHPIGPLLYAISTMHCMTVSLAQGGAGLGAMWGEELALEMLGEAGFGPVEVHTLDHDFQNNYYVATPYGRG